MSDGSHDIPPDFRSVQDVGGAPFESTHYVSSNLLWVGEARGVSQVIGHGSLDRSGFDGDDADAGWMETAAESLEKEGKRAFGGTVNVVGAASSISGDGGDGGQASGSPTLQIGGK